MQDENLVSLTHLLRQRVMHQPEKQIYTFLADGETIEETLTCNQLDHQARKIGSALQVRLNAGERALLLYPPGLDYIMAFFGCLYANVIAVPVYPPDPTRINRTLPRLQTIIADAQPSIILTNSSIMAMGQLLLAQHDGFQTIQWLATDNLDEELAHGWQELKTETEQLAFLQYTSGSTGQPKGVMLTHGNLLHNSRLIHRCFGHSLQSQGVIWLPPYHDMGLIGGIIQPLYGNFPVTLISPIDFLKRPFRWLQAVSRYKATTSGGPNFAYDLCIRKITPEQRATLDLSHWDLAFNGAEPIRSETMQRFAETFASCGFKATAFYPCYGLAEATLIVSGGLKSQPIVTHLAPDTDIAAPPIVGCGQTLPAQQIIVVEPQTHNRCINGERGEIWVAGPSVAQGYWRNQDATDETFQAYTTDTEEGPFLRTGDIGFLKDGELFVAGRLKDLIIIHGRNHYPHDIEQTAEKSHSALRPGCSAAFAINHDGQEKLIVVQEVRRNIPESEYSAILAQIRQAVLVEHDVTVHHLVLIETGTIQKTSSGKIQRYAMKADYVTKKLKVVADSELDDAPQTTPSDKKVSKINFWQRMLSAVTNSQDRQNLIGLILQEVIADVFNLPVEAVDTGQPINQLGLDSLTAIELVHECETILNQPIPQVMLLQGASIQAVAEELCASTTTPNNIVVSEQVEGYHPLSQGQRAMWFLHQLAPESDAYNIISTVKIKGDLQVQTLRQAFEVLITMHPSLRTVFRLVNEEPMQYVQAKGTFEWAEMDASDWDEAQLLAAITAVARRPFNLTQGPLMRVHIFRQKSDVYWLTWNLHHIITDFWSIALLAPQLIRFYEEASQQGQLALPKATFLTYADYARWQQTQLTETERHYWEQQLKHPLPELNLPTDYPRPATQSYTGASISLDLDVATSVRLRQLAKQEGTTLYMLLLSAYYILLHRYTGQEDIIVGTPTVGRPASDLAHVVGYFVNPVALRMGISKQVTYLDFLQQVKRMVLEAFAHQDYPFNVLVEHIQPNRDPARSPIYQTIFIWQQTPPHADTALAPFALGEVGAQISLADLSVTSVALPHRSAQFDLTLVMAENEGKLQTSLQYNCDLFKEESMRQMVHNWQTLLATLVDHPQQAIGELNLLPFSEQEKLLHTWNDTGMAYPQDLCWHDLFTQQAARTPFAQAVKFGETVWTYRQLEQKTNQFAHYLQAQGVQTGDRVAVLTPRSLNMLVALIGIMKTGASYIPIDPTYPLERIRFILTDAQVTVGLIDGSSLSLVDQLPAPLLQLDEIDEVYLDTPPDDVTKYAQQTAYLIYTSGSTGKAKGVEIPHRALVNFLMSMQAQLGLTAVDRLLAVTTISFDIAGLELFLPLIVGARVDIASDAMISSGVRIARYMEDEAITVLQATPATWWLLLESQWQGKPDLMMLSGGEALPHNLANRLLSKGKALWNMYGPTETTIWSIISRVLPGDEIVPIGRPISNTQVYILDDNLNPVPTGVVGSLYIGGDGVAQGYFNRPSLTAERFIPHPVRAGQRVYHTGDLARYLPDGTVLFLGRSDFQVKLRGHRIELGEVETTLARHTAVTRAVCAVHDQKLVAYIIPAHPHNPPKVTILRGHLSQILPNYMIPNMFVMLDRFPLTPNGKVDRKSLPIPIQERPELAIPYTAPQNVLERDLVHIWQELLGLSQVGVNDNFFELGGHSLLLTRLHRRLEQELSLNVSIVELFQYPTIHALAQYVSQPDTLQDPLVVTPTVTTTSDVAIIGMTGRFPGASTLSDFWCNLSNGVESVTFFEDDEIEATATMRQDPNYVNAGAVLDGVELFDAAFFGYSPRQSAQMDPQHRLFLECAWEALEQAGYDTEQYHKPIGIFTGVGFNAYLLNNLYGHHDTQISANNYELFLGNDKDFVPTRVSYKLNLQGPSINVQTACSSSLVAVHMASRSLQQGECDMALAGGVSLNLPQKAGYVYQEGGIPSPDGHCRAFDAEAKGTVRGSGVGIIVVKRLDDAVRDGDTIWAVIKGSAINNDGSQKVGYTAPSVDGQARVIAQAQAVAQVPADTITYIEAHGTGTTLGDPIEIYALSQAFRAQTDRVNYCAIGSVKTNIGHLDTAAGIAGLIKAALALHHKQIPPSLNYDTPNPKINFEDSPFFINTALKKWENGASPRRAGVSAFGLGGTNAHLVLEEAPLQPESTPSKRIWHLLVLSAQTEAALEAAVAQLTTYLQANPNLNLADVAYTLQVGRRSFSHRQAVVCSDREGAIHALTNVNEIVTDVQKTQQSPIVFMFPGQGAQYVHMGRDLYEVEPVFQTAVDECATYLIDHLDIDIRHLLFDEEMADQLQATNIAQPALFTIEYALAQLWLSWGITPAAMIGHSIGEYVAACLAGVFTLPDALALVARRGKLMSQLPPGDMLTVSLPPAEVKRFLNRDIELATVNGPALCVVSGTREAIAALADQLDTEGVPHRLLHTSHAFHSVMMEPAVAPFQTAVAEYSLTAPSIPFISNVTGTWIAAEEATDPRYWATHLRRPVQFAEGLTQLLADPDYIFLEVGPGRTLSTLVRQHSQKQVTNVVIPSMRHPHDSQSDMAFLWRSVSQLWLTGMPIDWKRFYQNESRQRLPLPAYPFQRQPYWVDPPEPRAISTNIRVRQPLQDWFYAPLWRQTPIPFLPRLSAAEERHWLLLVDSHGVGQELVKQLQILGESVAMVQIGAEFAQLADAVYAVRPSAREDYAVLWRTLAKLPSHIVHTWSITQMEESVDLSRGFYSLLALTQSIEAEQWTQPIELTILSNNTYRVTTEAPTYPLKATLQGPCRVIPQEYPHIQCRHIDLWGLDARHILADILTATEQQSVAYRYGQRWVMQYEAQSLLEATDVPPHLRQSGVYLIVGGLGGVGLILAEYLARTVQPTLILTGRSAFPYPDEWAGWLAAHAEYDETSQKIRAIQTLQVYGATVHTRQMDLTDKQQVQTAVDQIVTQFGALHGIVHCAGVAGGGMMQMKTASSAANVLAPKLMGTQNLYDVLVPYQPDFLLLTSSITAITGGLGQMDYAAANAYLDAFAQTHAGQSKMWVAAINWDRWDEVGMAASSTKKRINHPLLHYQLARMPQTQIYTAVFSPRTHWVLAEHKVMGIPTVPGATYVEMARAAFGMSQATLQELVFMTPLQVTEGEKREVVTILEHQGDVQVIRIVSQLPDGNWQEHVRGYIRPLANPVPMVSQNTAAIRDRCQPVDIHERLQTRRHAFLETGGRWHCIRDMYVGKGEGLAVLALAEANQSEDLQQFYIHPALLDVATGLVQWLGDGNYLPLAYEQIHIYAPLPAYLLSHIRFTGEQTGETLLCDVTLMDETGSVLVEIHGFTMRRVHEERAQNLQNRTTAVVPAPHIPTNIETVYWQMMLGEQAYAIQPHEGQEAYHRLLTYLTWPQVIISVRDLTAVQQHARTLTKNKLIDSLAQSSPDIQIKHARPNVKNPYVPPSNELEQTIATVLQNTLGLDRVGIHDNFFELGGSSLTGIQFVTELKGILNRDIPTVSIFEAPTVHLLAKYLNPDAQEETNRVQKGRRRAAQKREVMHETGRKRRR